MLGIMLIDMQEKHTINDAKEKEHLISTQIRLLNYAIQKEIPVFTLEYIGEGKTIQELQENLKNTKNHFIRKYNYNAFIHIKESDLQKLNSISYGALLFGDEFGKDSPENKKLISLLKKNKIKNIILTGIYKKDCMFKTAKGAKKRGYEIFTSDELMDKQKLDIDWYFKNSHHYKTLDELIKNIERLNIDSN